MSSYSPLPSVAVIGAGVAGASCARTLSQSGWAVHVVDKSRGPGGRLASRRLSWLDPQGCTRSAKVDHGAPAFTAAGADFRQFLARSSPPGSALPWRPVLAAGSRPLDGAGSLWLSAPDMPSLCRGWLQQVAATWSFAVDRLHREPDGWRIESGGKALPAQFDAVVLAMPPAQAATLLTPLRGDWAQRASLAPMHPCWTLMGVARRSGAIRPWDVCRPDQGPLAWVMHHDTRPGRERQDDEVHWVAHARPGWSRRQLEQPAEWVLPRMQSALSEVLDEPIDWCHATVHRWRFAIPALVGAAPDRPCWWDGARGLGVCGDFLGGGGVEGAWQSAQALATTMSRASVDAAPAFGPFSDDPPVGRAAA